MTRIGDACQASIPTQTHSGASKVGNLAFHCAVPTSLLRGSSCQRAGWVPLAAALGRQCRCRLVRKKHWRVKAPASGTRSSRLKKTVYYKCVSVRANGDTIGVPGNPIADCNQEFSCGVALDAPPRPSARPSSFISPATKASLPLEDAVQTWLDEGQTAWLKIVGGTGSGKTTALVHLAAVYGGLSRLAFLDEGRRPIGRLPKIPRHAHRLHREFQRKHPVHTLTLARGAGTN